MFNMGYARVPPPHKRRKTRLTMLPEEPKIRDEADILILLENRKIELPQPWTQRHRVRKDPEEGKCTIIREGARQNVHKTHQASMHTGVDRVIPGSKFPLRPRPGKPKKTRVPFMPNIHNTTIQKHHRQTSRIFTRNFKRTWATAIHNAIKEIAAQENGDSRIKSIDATNKELVTVRITIRSIDTSHTKDRATKNQLNQLKMTVKFTYHLPTIKNQTIQDSDITRINRSKGACTQKTTTGNR